MRRIVIMLLALGAIIGANAAVFQYSTTVGANNAPVLMWVPAEADQLRGVVIGGSTVMEIEVVRDPMVRQACRQEKLALVLIKSGLDGVDVPALLDNLAKISGYKELSVIPVLPIGHSAGGPQAKALAYKMASRCFGLIQFRGGWPTAEGAAAPDGLNGIPCLAAIGQFDEFWGLMRNKEGRDNWERFRDNVKDYRKGNENRLASLIVEPGAGHFAWSERQAIYVSKFISKAAQARIPAVIPADATEPIKLNTIDPHTGWLTDMTIKTQGEFAPAPYDQYKGDKATAAWHFDEEMAMATVAYTAGQLNKPDQFITWKNIQFVDAGVRNFISPTKLDDGVTMSLQPYYSATYPTNTGKPNTGPYWAEPGKAVGNSGAPIFMKIFSGPAEMTGMNTFRIKLDEMTSIGNIGGNKIYFMAYNPGNANFRYTENVSILRSAPLNGGKAQTITFADLDPVKANAGVIELKATSDSGLPVEYYVASGPAVIEGNRLRLLEIPAKAVFPIEVKIVAYQMGRYTEPQIATAPLATKVLRIDAVK